MGPEAPTERRCVTMAEISPKVQARLNELSPELRDAVLAKGVPLHSLYDLIGVLNQLIRENEA